MLGAEIEPVLAPRTEITSLINRAYRHKADGVDEALADVAEDGDIAGLAEEIEETEDVLDVANKAPIIKLVNMILFQALKLRASDVHFQPYADRLQVRYRIDGILYDMDPIPHKVQDAIISRVKVMGKMDIAERRLPQDGRATIRIGDGEVDVRISSVPDDQRRAHRACACSTRRAKLYTLRRDRPRRRSNPRPCCATTSTTATASSSSRARPARARRPRSTRALTRGQHDRRRTC